MSKSTVFYKIVKAKHGHPFAGLYAVMKFVVKAHQVVSREVVKEWDLRILTEAALARFGGSQAFDEYISDNGEPDGLEDIPMAEPVAARTAEELALTKRKLDKELKLRAE